MPTRDKRSRTNERRSRRPAVARSSAVSPELRLWFQDEADRFIDAHYVAREPLVVHGPVTRFGLRLEAFDDVGRLIRSAPASPPLTVFMPNAELGPQQIQTDPQSAEVCYRGGCTVSIEHAVVAGVENLAKALGRELGTRATPAAILSPVGESVPAHFDGIDAFVLMIRGKKRWTIAPNQFEFPNYPYFPNIAGAGRRGHEPNIPPHLAASLPMTMPEHGTRTFELRAGSVAFVPSGWWHRTECSEPSVSFTVRVSNPDFASVFGQAVTLKLLRHAALRAPLLLLRKPAHRERALASVGGALKSALDEIAKLDVGDIQSSLLGPYYRRVSGRLVRFEKKASEPRTTRVLVTRSGRKGVKKFEMDEDFMPPLRWIVEQESGFFESEFIAEFPGFTRGEIQSALDFCAAAEVVTRLDKVDTDR
jgi:50S ribosomal protein L16 3-hydroxylase